MRCNESRCLVVLGSLIAQLTIAISDAKGSEDAQAPELWVSPYVTHANQALQGIHHPSTHLRSEASRILKHRRIELGPPSEHEISDRMRQSYRGPTKIGFSRGLQEFSSTQKTRKELEWKPVSDGGVSTVLTFTSAGAKALRLGLGVMNLPAGIEFRFYQENANEAQLVTGSEILDIIEKNLAAGDEENIARTYWSPVVSGEKISLEIYLPPPFSADDVDMSIPAISHLMASPTGDLEGLMARASGVGDSGSCNIDASCDANWKDRSNAVAKMIYTSGAYSYLCSGTLLNDATSSGTPYFLTANHCISSQSVASTLNTYWFYRSSSCNSGQLSPVYQALSTGATLLYHGSDTDSSFLRLNSTPPGGVTYSGWTTAAPTKTIAATGLHHPKGDLLKISYGSITDFLNCTTPNLDGSFNCSSSVTGNYVDIRYTSGTTEGGSSGSGIFLNDGQHLFGQLYGGNSTCSNLSGSNIYGRFDRAYSVGNLGQWLNASGTTSIIRTGSGTIRSAPEGINCGSVCAHDFTQGSKVTLVAIPQPGRRFLGWSGACTGKIAACILRVNGPLNVQANFSP